MNSFNDAAAADNKDMNYCISGSLTYVYFSVYPKYRLLSMLYIKGKVQYIGYYKTIKL